MAVTVTHATQSAAPDSGDGKISSNAWNESHTVSGLGTAAEADATDFAAATHNHAIADVTGLQAALDGKQASGSYLTSITSGNVTSALGYTPTSVTGLTGVQSVAALKAGLSLVKGDVGLGSVDNTADSAKSVLSAATLTTPRTINGVSFNGSANITINAVDSTARLAASAVSAFGLTLIDDADAAAARSTLGLGTLATQSGTFSGTSSGTNTGDQDLSGYATTAALAAKAPLASPQFTGVTYYQQPTPTAFTNSATLTIADLLTLILTVTKTTAVTLTLPTGTLTDAGILSGALATNEAFEWYVINLGTSSGATTILAGTGHTIVGNAVVAIGTSARFLTRKTATNTFVTYRIA